MSRFVMCLRWRMLGGRVSTRDDRSVSTIGKTPEVPGLGEEDGFSQEEGQDLVRTRARACQDFHGAV